MHLGVVQVPDFDDVYCWLKGAITGDVGGQRDRMGFFDGGWALDRSVVVKFGDSDVKYYKAGDLDEMGFPQYDLWKVPGGLYSNPGPDGLIHTEKSRAEEKKRDVRRVRRIVRRAVLQAKRNLKPPAGWSRNVIPFDFSPVTFTHNACPIK